MNVQHEQLKNLMVRDKIFLKELYEGNDLEQKRRILNFSSDSKVASRYIDRTLYFFFLSKNKVYNILTLFI